MKFYYHNSIGMDINGNGGPSPKTPGWVEIDCATYEEAIIRLSPEAREHVIAVFDAWRMGVDMPQACFADFVADTCMQGVGFSFMDEISWENFCESES